MEKTEVIIEIGTRKVPHTILIADIENEGILGMDVLADNQCDIMLSRQFLKINGEKEELLSVNTTKTVSNSDSTYSETDIPDHLQDLYSNSSEHLSEHEKSQLIKYQNSFSKSSHDLGLTSIIEHTINLVPDTRPIKQPPYRLPLGRK